MKKSITDYYKRTVELAGNATRAISKARADYERDSVLLKNAYEADMYGERDKSYPCGLSGTGE